MNKDLIEFYEEEKNRIQKEIDDLWEVGKKSPKIVNRLVEIEYILDGLEADKKIRQLNEENKALRKRLMQEGIEVSE
nr:MAG TPA: Kinesin-associated [Caudoviricetes sp.]